MAKIPRYRYIYKQFKLNGGLYNIFNSTTKLKYRLKNRIYKK